WPWLADKRLDPDNIQIGDDYNMQVAWPHLRLVRVRMENSPKVLYDYDRPIPAGEPGVNGHILPGAGMVPPEMATYRTPPWAEAQACRLADPVGSSRVYLSFGTLLRTGQVRGTSSYRSIPGTKLVRPPDGPIAAAGKKPPRVRRPATLAPYTHSWSTPVGVEF